MQVSPSSLLAKLKLNYFCNNRLKRAPDLTHDFLTTAAFSRERCEKCHAYSFFLPGSVDGQVELPFRHRHGNLSSSPLEKKCFLGVFRVGDLHATNVYSFFPFVEVNFF